MTSPHHLDHRHPARSLPKHRNPMKARTGLSRALPAATLAAAFTAAAIAAGITYTTTGGTVTGGNPSADTLAATDSRQPLSRGGERPTSEPLSDPTPPISPEGSVDTVQPGLGQQSAGTTTPQAEAATMNPTPRPERTQVMKPPATPKTESKAQPKTESKTPVAAPDEDVPAAGTLKAIARQMMLDYGYGPNQWSFLDRLITRESGWNPRAQNPSSGAYGLPQSLPGSKMASVAPDWRTNPRTQITWMLGYIKGRYGNPQGAWAHSERVGWY